MFKYNPDQVGFFERAAYRAMKMFYGAYPPIDAINYVWAGRHNCAEPVHLKA